MLAIWEYFWLEADWAGAAPAPAPTPAPTPERRGGKHRQYSSANPDFWEVRERYLRRYVEPIAKSAAIDISNKTATDLQRNIDVRPPGDAPSLLQQALQAAIGRARLAQTAAVLLDNAARAQQLALDIAATKQQYYNRAIALLLLIAD